MKFQREKEENMNVRIIMVMLVAIMLTALIGCATVREVVPFKVTYEIPTLTALENTPAVQEKHGVCISVTPYPFSATRKVHTEYTETYFGFGYPNIKRTPYYEVEPKQVLFKVKIRNNMNHVLRLAGTVVAHRINNQTRVVSYKPLNEDLLASAILPGQEKEYPDFGIGFGPSIDSLSEGCTLALLLYDIVTKTDAAGNPIERTNFEWCYTFNKTTVIKSDEVTIRKTK